jgi:hypothetical protein
VEALPKKNFGSPSSVHAYFRDWEKQGFFLELWQRGLSEFDDLEDIAWEWQAIDGSKAAQSDISSAALGGGSLSRMAQ